MNQHNIMQLLAYKAQTMQFTIYMQYKDTMPYAKVPFDISIHVVLHFSCHFLNTLTYKILIKNHNMIEDSLMNNPHEDHFA